MFHSETSLFFLVLFSVSSTSWIQKVLPLNVLVSTPYGDLNSWNITARQYLNASHFYLVMQPDCNLVTYNGSTPFLTTNLSELARGEGSAGPVGPSNARNCYATMQSDGNFVVYQKLNTTYRIPVWESGTYSRVTRNSSYRYLILGRDGSLEAYEPDGAALTMLYPFRASREVAPSPAPATSQSATPNLSYPFPPELEWKPSMPLDGYPYMPEEYYLSQGSKLQTLNGRFILTLGHDCKLQSQEIWKDNNTAKSVIWEPQRSMFGAVSGNCALRLQQDGRLEIRDNVSGVVYWKSSVSGEDSVNWVLKLGADDGHVSVSDIMDPRNILWTSIDAGFTPGSGTVGIWPVVVGVIGGVFFMAMAVFGLWYFYFRPSSLNPTEKAFQRRLRSVGGRSQVLSGAKIKQATNNFGCRIGYGGFGDVFYGKLEDGQEIAAKVLSSGSHQSKEEFYNEIELLSMVHHKYLVTLIGYSFTPQHQILVYEYMSGGDLRHRLSQGNSVAESPFSWRERTSITLQVAEGIEYLHEKCTPAIIHRDIKRAGAARSPLSWRQRTSIAVQVAEGLEYLHDKCSPSIIHRDVKSNNILLTTSLNVAKVADFGLSKLRRKDQEDATHVTTVVKGTPGYLDPEYHETGMLTEKSDVYAFGIVLMEILTGLNQMSISQTVSEARRLEQYEGLADPNLGGRFDRDEFVSLVELSLWCVRKSNLKRPFMREVVAKMREIGITSLESMPPEPVMRFGDSFEHSEEDVAVMSFDGFSSITSVKDVSSG